MSFICVINVSSKGACASRLPPQKLTKYCHFYNLRVCWVLYAPAGSRGYAPKHSIFFSAVCHLGTILRLLSSLNFSIILCVHPSLHAGTKNNLEEKECFFCANQETANKPEIIPKPKHCIRVTNLTKHWSLGHAHWKSSIHTSPSAVGFQIGMHPFMTVFAVMAKTRPEKLDLHPAKAMITRCQLKHPTWHADINNEVPLLPWNTLECCGSLVRMWGICGQCILHRLCGHVLNITTNVWAEALKENGNIRSILCGWNIHHWRVHVSEGMHAKLSNTWYHLPTTTSNNDNQRHVCPAIVCPQYPKLHYSRSYKLHNFVCHAARLLRLDVQLFWHRCMSILRPLKRFS